MRKEMKENESNLRLRKILKEKHISGTELAHRLEVTPSYVNSAISGRFNLSIKQCERIAEVLGVPLASLFDGYIEPTETICPHCGKPIKIIIG